MRLAFPEIVTSYMVENVIGTHTRTHTHILGYLAMLKNYSKKISGSKFGSGSGWIPKFDECTQMHEDSFSRFYVQLLTHRQTDRQTNIQTNDGHYIMSFS